MVVREHLSQFTRAALIPNQTADTLREALIALILDLIPDEGTEIRTDGATAFQSLARECDQPTSILHNLKIKIVVGRLMNANKNPVAENAIQEVEKEILRLKANSNAITQTDLSIVMRNINSRIRYNNLTPKEILFRRDIISNKPANILDEDILEKQEHLKCKSSVASKKNKSKTRKPTTTQTFNTGDLVMVRNQRSKNDLYDLSASPHS